MPRKTNFKVELGNKIRTLRTQNSMTQEELGKKLNVGKSTIANYESGYSEPESEKIQKIAVIFNVSIDCLLNPNKNIAMNKKNKTLDRILGEKILIENIEKLNYFHLEENSLSEIMELLLEDDISQNKQNQINDYVYYNFGQNVELYETLLSIYKQISDTKDDYKKNISNFDDKKNIQSKYGPYSIELLEDYNKLNEFGKQKANENVKDLTKIDEYTKKNESNTANG